MDDIIAEAGRKMDQALDHAREEFSGIRTGRAHPAMFNKIQVDYYGALTPLQQLATFQVPEARVVLIAPYDRGAMHNIEKAIRDSDLGVNPANDGNVIRLVLPQLTEERRKEYIKLARHKAEEARVAVRNIRRHALEQVGKLQKAKEVGEDDARGAEKQLDAATKKRVDQVDELLKSKESELLEV
ncbi:MAG: ribosome recycling factor [Propionibacteriaceae bacterium]|nr:ribosome recycling factor [Propionibacteriaceae bacterium]